MMQITLARPPAGTVPSAEAPCTLSNGSPQLNSCCVLHPSPTYVPHEPATPASIDLRAPACIPPFVSHRDRSAHKTTPTILAPASRPHISASSTPSTDPRDTQHQPYDPYNSLQSDRKFIDSPRRAASFKSLYPQHQPSAFCSTNSPPRALQIQS